MPICRRSQAAEATALRGCPLIPPARRGCCASVCPSVFHVKRAHSRTCGEGVVRTRALEAPDTGEHGASGRYARGMQRQLRRMLVSPATHPCAVLCACKGATMMESRTGGRSATSSGQHRLWEGRAFAPLARRSVSRETHELVPHRGAHGRPSPGHVCTNRHCISVRPSALRRRKNPSSASSSSRRPIPVSRSWAPARVSPACRRYRQAVDAANHTDDCACASNARPSLSTPTTSMSALLCRMQSCASAPRDASRGARTCAPRWASISHDGQQLCFT